MLLYELEYNLVQATTQNVVKTKNLINKHFLKNRIQRWTYFSTAIYLSFQLTVSMMVELGNQYSSYSGVINDSVYWTNPNF